MTKEALHEMFCVRTNELFLRQGRQVQLPEGLCLRQIEDAAEIALRTQSERSR